MPDRATVVVGGAFVGAIAYLIGVAWAMNHATYDVWGPLVILPALVLLGVVAFRAVGRVEADPRMSRLLLVAFVAKMVGTLARYLVSFDFYDKADAQGYHLAGVELARRFRQGDFSIGNARLDGGRVLEIITGAIYTVIGPTRTGGFIVFSLLSFVGTYLFYRAFRQACPTGDHRRYALLLFFLPSMLYWPSSIGKEAWMILAIGLVALGASRLLTGARHGLFPLVLGLAGGTAVRPHVGLLLVGGITAAYLVRKSPRQSPLAPAAKALGIIVLLVGGFLALSRAQGVLGLEGLNQNAVGNLLNRTQAQTSGGGSQFTPVRVNTPLDLPLATVTVLFRPFPFEADSIQTLGAAAEGVVLLGLFVVGFRRVRRMFKLARHSPYLVFVIVYTLGFIVAFSAIANFGILTRQRVQVLPIVLTLLALPAPTRQPEPEGAAAWVPGVGRMPLRTPGN